MEIIVNDSFEVALRIFTKRFKDSGLPRELRERQYHMTRMERRKIKDRRALLRFNKQQAKRREGER